MIRIAGREVKLNDRLYHQGFGLWGEVVEQDDMSVVVAIKGQGEGNVRRLIVTDGGLVSGKRQMFWHTPIVLDLPRGDITPYQFMIESTRQLLGDL